MTTDQDWVGNIGLSDLDATVHMCPPGDEVLMPCCGISPFERLGDRITNDPARVTCDERSAIGVLDRAVKETG